MNTNNNTNTCITFNLSSETQAQPISPMMSLEGKVCVVTGSSSGLGEAIAIMFAQRGASVTLCGRDVTRLQTTFTSCVEASGGHASRFLSVAGDVTTSSCREDIVQKTVEKFGRIDVLVANAGMTDPQGGVDTAKETTFDNIFNVNVKSVFFLIQKAVGHLRASKGSIVVVSSITSLNAATPNIVYPMSKAAIDHMVRCLAVDLGPDNIRVNAVNPGFIPTRIRRMFGENQDAVDAQNCRAQEAEVRKQPLGTTAITKEGVAETVCFLSSAASGFVTGQCIPVDAGRVFAGAFGTTAPGK